MPQAVEIARTTEVTDEARSYVDREGLGGALDRVIGFGTTGAPCAGVGVSLMRYDDLSGVTLVKVTLRYGLRGRDAVAKEDEIFERMWKVMDTETMNRFLVVVE